MLSHFTVPQIPMALSSHQGEGLSVRGTIYLCNPELGSNVRTLSQVYLGISPLSWTTRLQWVGAREWITQVLVSTFLWSSRQPLIELFPITGSEILGAGPWFLCPPGNCIILQHSLPPSDAVPESESGLQPLVLPNDLLRGRNMDHLFISWFIGDQEGPAVEQSWPCPAGQAYWRDAFGHLLLGPLSHAAPGSQRSLFIQSNAQISGESCLTTGVGSVAIARDTGGCPVICGPWLLMPQPCSNLNLGIFGSTWGRLRVHKMFCKIRFRSKWPGG